MPEKLQDDKIKLMYSDSSGEWRVLNKSADSKDNVRVHTTYGTKRINAYEIFEATLNQRDVRILIKNGWMGRKPVFSTKNRPPLPSRSRRQPVRRSRTEFLRIRSAGRPCAGNIMIRSTTSGPGSMTVPASIWWA